MAFVTPLFAEVAALAPVAPRLEASNTRLDHGLVGPVCGLKQSASRAKFMGLVEAVSATIVAPAVHLILDCKAIVSRWVRTD